MKQMVDPNSSGKMTGFKGSLEAYIILKMFLHKYIKKEKLKTPRILSDYLRFFRMFILQLYAGVTENVQTGSMPPL